MSNIIKRIRVRKIEQELKDLEEEKVTTQENQKIEDSEGNLSPANLQKIEDEHQKILEKFENEIQKRQEEVDIKIEKQLQETATKCEEMEQAARKQYDAILVQAQAEGEDIINNAIAQANNITTQAQNERLALIDNVENEVAQTILTLVNHIVGEGLIDNTDWIKVLIRKMLKVNHTTGFLKLFVNEHNLQYIEANEITFRKGLPHQLTIERDDTLKDTECHLMTEEGTIEYDVQEGLQKVINDLRVLSKLS